MKYKKIHILGIGGAGLNAIAYLLLDQGISITGADKIRNAATAALEQKGVKIYDDQDTTPLISADALLMTSAVKPGHVLWEYAKEHHTPVLTRHDLWKEWSKSRQVIAVAGSHGKTSTSSLLAYITESSGRDCGYVLGFHGAHSGHWGSQELIAEADEYAKTFLSLKPIISVVTNIDRDHVDIYKTDDDYRNTFRQFAETTIANKGQVIANTDDPGVRIAFRNLKNVKYGLHDPNLDWYATNLAYSSKSTSFDLYHKKRFISRCELSLLGEHNVANALAVLAAAHSIGIFPKRAITYLKSYPGIPRRMELKANFNNIHIFNDYGHAPNEIQSTLSALRHAFPDSRLVCYFQPHTFSRINSFFDDYMRVLGVADVVRVGDVYASRDLNGFADLPKLIKGINCPDKAQIGDVNNATEYFKKFLKPNDVFVAFTAGNGSQVPEELAKYLESVYKT